MQFTLAAILAVAATVAAVPVADSSYGAPAAAPSDPAPAPQLTCAEGSKVSCCVSNNGNSGIGGNILGGSCLLDQVSLLSILDNQCPAGNTFCCPASQDGTLNINAECLPINA